LKIVREKSWNIY